LLAVCVLSAQTEDKEAALGKVLASDMDGRTRAVHDTRIEEYVQHLGDRIAAQMPAARYPFTFHVIADDTCPATHEPVALPGGYIFVPIALFKAAKDEAEFAGMLALAMEHVALRHGEPPTGQGRIDNLGKIPLIYVGGGIGFCAGQALVPMSFRETARRNEEEAKAAATQVLARIKFEERSGEFVAIQERVRALSTTQ